MEDLQRQAAPLGQVLRRRRGFGLRRARRAWCHTSQPLSFPRLAPRVSQSQSQALRGNPPRDKPETNPDTSPDTSPETAELGLALAWLGTAGDPLAGLQVTPDTGTSSREPHSSSWSSCFCWVPTWRLWCGLTALWAEEGTL